MKRTKIVCTIGPSSQKKSILTKMIRAGMDVARLNFSHGEYTTHAKLIKNIRLASAKIGRPVAIMQDLQGPRIRVGIVKKDGIDLSRHDAVALYYEKKILGSAEKNIKKIPIQFKSLHSYVKKGVHILINDGLIDIKVDKITNEIIYGTVIKPGIIFSHKGINIPSVKIKTAALTEKDKLDLQFGLKQKIDFVALSFVNSSQDVQHLKRIIKTTKQPVQIIAKIETKTGVDNFAEILKITDGVMVARGDLGIEMPPDKVPLIQKDMIRASLKAAKPVIVATQMLDSMILNPRPTRAEVSDVANAVIDHTDAVMLSGETAFGKYPVETVSMMAQIIKETERSPYDDVGSHFLMNKKAEMSESVSANVFDLVKENKAKAIIIDSISGLSARLISRFRPETNIIVITKTKKTIHELALTWGTSAYYLKSCRTLDELLRRSIALVKKKRLVKKGDKIILVTGHPVGYKKGMNLIKVQEIN